MIRRLPLLQLRKASSEDAYNATVVGTHDFGVFAELDEYGVEGLVPASKVRVFFFLLVLCLAGRRPEGKEPPIGSQHFLKSRREPKPEPLLI